MANKKISQLTTAANVGVGDYFPVAVAAGGSNFTTKKAETETVATYMLSPIPSAISQVGFTGNNELYLKKNNWTNASDQNVESFPFLQVRVSDGLLVTGSGVAFDSTTVPWDYNAASSIDMQGNDINNLDDILFQSSNSTIARQTNVQDLLIKAGNDLTLSGVRHVSVSGQALDLASTPISGNVTVTGGNLEIDPGNKLIVNEITATDASTDKAAISIEGASLHIPIDINAHTDDYGDADIYWNESNIQFATVYDGSSGYIFNGAKPGQTLTMYVENAAASASYTPTFNTPPASGASDVIWGGTGGPPHIDAHRTNMYTFVCIGTGVFASAITGYEYT
tara:strand:+ start:59 stop:1072 length:1014 start_codon:yes stop_codon:yes gene_type:complete